MPEISQEELDKLKAAAESANALISKVDRLEDESKKYKQRAQDAETKVSDAEKAKLESDGNLEKLLATEREEKSKLSEKLKGQTNKVLTQTLRVELSQHAKDAHDVDALLSASKHKDLLKLDEDELSVTGVEEFVTKTREEQSYLFKKKVLDDGSDGGKKPGTNDDLKTDEEKYRAELEKCTTRKELDEVRKKYGKED